MARFSFTHASDLDDLGAAGSRFQWNLRALRTLQEVERAQREPTHDEQRILAHYTSFGDSALTKRILGDALNPDGSHKPAEIVQDLITHEELQATLRAALTAFYTPVGVAQAIWAAVQRLGVGNLESIKVLEPAFGAVGMFAATMPEELRDRAQIVAVELDVLSCRIARLLHPDVQLIGPQGFEDTETPDSYFDLAISNVPFGSIPMADRRYRDNPFLARTIHDYFIARMFDAVRPGGIVALLTSYGTMDKNDDRVRHWISTQGKLLAALRLPNGVFEDNAGSMAGTDLLIFQKYEEGEDRAKDVGWIVSVRTNLPTVHGKKHHVTQSQKCDGNGGQPAIRCNPRFHPASRDVLGRYEAFYSSDAGYSYYYAVVPLDEYPLADRIRARTRDLPENIVRPSAVLVPERKAIERSTDALIIGEVPSAQQARMEQALGVFKAAKRLIALDRANDPEANEARRQLGARYDEYVQAYGTFHDQRSRRTVGKYLAEYIFLLGLEHSPRSDVVTKRVVVEKAAIFARNVQRPVAAVEGTLTPQEALAVCLNERAEVDIDYICDLSGLGRAQVIEALDRVIYRVPDLRCEEYVTADEYLAGNVRAKLTAARKAALINPALFSKHVAALDARVPTAIPPSDIRANLGANWIPPEVIQQFVCALIPEHKPSSGSVTYHKAIDKWDLSYSRWSADNFNATTTWGTGRRDAFEIIQDCLDRRLSVVYDTHEDGSRTLNDQATLAVQEKQTAIKEKFAQWLWEDNERAALIADIYNERFNGMVNPSYDGSHLTLPGINGAALRVGDLDPHQKNARVARPARAHHAAGAPGRRRQDLRDGRHRARGSSARHLAEADDGGAEQPGRGAGEGGAAALPAHARPGDAA